MTDERQSASPSPVPSEPPSEARTITSGGEFLLQVVRTFGGYTVLFACLMLLLRTPPWSLSVLDIVFWAVSCLVLWLHRREAVAAGQLAAWPPVRNLHLAASLGLWVAAQSLHPLT